MATITFFIQTRQDSGVRSGVDVNGNSVLTRFNAGSGDEPDPAIRWYVDVRCSGMVLPSGGDGARQWLAEHAPQIKAALLAAAQQIPAGIDPGDWPYRYESKIGAARKISIVCSAVRQVDARELGGILKDLAKNWNRHLHQLSSLAEVG